MEHLMPKILIVEDDIGIAKKLALFLQKSGFNTEHLDSGLNVIKTVKKSMPDLILLDLMLPYKTGEECCTQIREFSQVPIIMATAKVEEIDRLIGLEAGADDYICKPYSLMELVLRIKAILRRTAPAIDSSKPEITINKDTLEVLFQGKDAEFTSLEFSLFELLFKQPGRIYSRQLILDLAYSSLRDISDRSIDGHIKKIRKKIRALGIEDNVIESVYGAGYRLVLPKW